MGSEDGRAALEPKPGTTSVRRWGADTRGGCSVCSSNGTSDSLIIVLDEQLHQLSTSKMKLSKAPELLKKAVTAFKSKTDALRTKLIILASLRRRMAMVGAMSRRIHALVSSDQEKQARVEYSDKALVLRKAMAASKEPAGDHDGKIDLNLFKVAMFDEDDHGYPDWTRSLFDDDNCYNEDDEVDDHENHDVLDAALDEPSVIEIIRSNREVEGLEFNMDDEIDEACDMFIRRFRNRMNRSF
ncbi:uncharacterized protein LOC133902341 [Phragmites australis]|uniref:uncharacterized protein LOC133902341 n=1 Tax=Phragmites australis TaxID=29695 RepID=UPI002D795856|nr:uncharacterized protein LOC133902341 [Phragmites australis]